MNIPSADSPTCYAECSSGPKEETKLFCGEVKETHGICVRHGRMSTNGELRFRLNSLKDGSAYIRTQTTGESKGWQNPHFHKRLKETYIVEKGWIGYVELVSGTPVYKKFCPGDVFTTSPEVVHNIYMSADSVIHTVKHSGGPTDATGKSDWWGGDDRCSRLSQLVGQGFPDDVRCIASPIDQPENDPEKTYNAAYRHFDTLIWQVPAWSSALFAAIVASVNSFLTPSSPQAATTTPSQSSNAIAALLRLSTDDFAAIQIGLFGVFTLVLGYALCRFRWHQVGTRTWSKTLTSPKISPQTLLQALVNVEAALLLFVAGALAGLPKSAVGVAVLLIIGYLFCRWEQQISSRAIAHNLPETRETDPKEKTPISGAS